MNKFALPFLILIAPVAIAAENSVPRPAAEPDGARQEKQAEKGQRLLCRRVEGTGTRVGAQRLCMTAREWRAYGDR